MPFIVLALIVAAALGGGLSVAAEQSLPNNLLWGFKVEVNERLQETLAQGEQAKAEVDSMLAQTRLDEALKLAAGLQPQIKNNFDAHLRDIATRVANLQAQGEYTEAANLAGHLQTMLARYISALPEVKNALDSANKLSADASAQAAAH